MFYPPKIKKLSPGFTLVEVLVAIGILVMLIMAAFTLESLSIRSSSYNRHKVQALGRAQEGLNAVHSIRDQSLVDSNGQRAFNGFTAPCDGNESTICHLVKDPGGTWRLEEGSADALPFSSTDNAKYNVEITIE